MQYTNAIQSVNETHVSPDNFPIFLKNPELPKGLCM